MSKFEDFYGNPIDDILLATQSSNGLMAKEDKTKLDNIDSNNIQNNIISKIYPIGSIYISTNNINPSTLFGGVWEQFSKGQVLVGIDESQEEFNTVLKQGGEKSHKLTIDEMPSHNHGIKIENKQDTAGIHTDNNRYGTSNTINSNIIQNTGNGLPHNNLQPYIVVYIWKRIS